MRINIARLALLALLALLAVAPLQPALAAQRTFVSTSGSDSNPCSLAAPCRSFAKAITATDTRGEIIVLASGGYGRVTIDKSVAIHAPPGIYAGISVFAGTNGIDITTPGIEVALRGLTINGQGGDDGISLAAASILDVERCAVAHMTRYGIVANVDGANLSIQNSSSNDNAFSGVYLTGDMRFRIDRVRVERNGDAGFRVRDGAIGSIVDSVVSGNGNGVLVGNQEAGVAIALVLSGSRIQGNDGNGITVATGMPGTFKFEGNDNVISNNGSNGIAVAAAGGGTAVATLRRNTIAHNGSWGAIVSTIGATLNIADNVIVGNGSRGLLQQTNGVLNSLGNNVVRDNDLGVSLGVISPIAPI